MIQRVWMVAARDFSVTVSNKGFLFGILLMPILICLFVFLGPRILSGRSPVVEGQVAVVDATGSLISDVRLDLGPLAIAARRAPPLGISPAVRDSLAHPRWGFPRSPLGRRSVTGRGATKPFAKRRSADSEYFGG